MGQKVKGHSGERCHQVTANDPALRTEAVLVLLLFFTPARLKLLRENNGKPAVEAEPL